MRIFTHNVDVSWEETFDQLARSYGTEATNGAFTIPEAFGSGHMRMSLPASDDLAVFYFDYSCAVPAYEGVRRAARRVYYLSFSNNKLAGLESHMVQAGDVGITTSAMEWKHTFLMSSQHDLLTLQPPGFSTSMLLLAFTEEWLGRKIDVALPANFYDRYLLLRARTFTVIPLSEEMERRVEEIRQGMTLGWPIAKTDAECAALATIYFRELMLATSVAVESRSNESDIIRLLDYVHKGGEAFYLQPSGRAALARELGMSASKLGLLFKEVFSQPYSDYLSTRRMEWAMTKLAAGEMKVGETASTLGYENYSRFSSAFKKQFGILPSAVLKDKGQDQ